MKQFSTNFNEIFDVDYKTGTVKIKGTDTVVPSLRYDKNSGEIRSYGVKSFEKRSADVIHANTNTDSGDNDEFLAALLFGDDDDTKPDRDTVIEVNGKLSEWDGSDILKTIDHHTNYRISTLGYVMNSRGMIMSSRDKKKDIDKHQKIDLWEGGKQKTCLVHRLVAEAFIPNPDNLPICHHIDHNPLNNRVDNLMWMSVEDHTKLHENDRCNAVKEALSITVEMCNPDTMEVKQTFPSAREAERITGFSNQGISAACNGIYSTNKGHIYKGFYWRFKQD